MEGEAMTLTAHETFELHILRRLARGPDWSQRFPRMKPILNRLVDKGHVRRFPARGSKIPLMVEITVSGLARLNELKRKSAR